MGTIHNQPVRPRMVDIDIVDTAFALQKNAANNGLGQLTAYEALSLSIDYHQANLDQHDRDVWDEQMSGLCNAFESIGGGLDSLWRAYADANGS